MTTLFIVYVAATFVLVGAFLVALFRSEPQAPPRDVAPSMEEEWIEELRDTVGIGRCPACGERSVGGTKAEGGSALAWCENGHTWVASAD